MYKRQGRPFFPDDVRIALLETPERRVLVTTPVHLQACVKAGLRWPATALLISATAPLSLELAAQAEAAFDAPVLEIYGCTEAGSIASRRTLHGDRWRLYDGFALDKGQLSGAHPVSYTHLDVYKRQGIADGQQDRLAFAASLRQRRLAPRLPVHRVMRVLTQIGAGFVNQMVGVVRFSVGHGVASNEGTRDNGLLLRGANGH